MSETVLMMAYQDGRCRAAAGATVAFVRAAQLPSIECGSGNHRAQPRRQVVPFQRPLDAWGRRPTAMTQDARASR